MIYKTFQDLRLSALGMGCMRLPLKGGDTEIDEHETACMIAYALEHGINYFDTAWGYHGGSSETVMGKVLSAYPRDRFFLASKFPGYDLGNMPKVQEIFARQLEKCQCGHFDFYLFHNVCELNIDAYLNKEYGILDHLLKQKEAGRIRHLGFSAHGSLDVMKRFLNAYGQHMEFCQIQLNYLDWTLQDAKAKVELLNAHHIPIWVMEPLRGGKLAALSQEDAAALQALRPAESIPGWAFRFLQSIPGVTMILSGMSSMPQLQDNVRTFASEQPLNDNEMKELLRIGGHMGASVPCTACHYCTTHCPQKLDIPELIRLYNDMVFSNGSFSARNAINAMPAEKQPSACIGCGSCQAVCPQQIHIPDIMKDLSERLRK
ncbi:MAG TPA: aldo/keto reductase [Candidatus Merdibacter merdavium]|uniref:Aldo/keto reductase n=1 Tax=Candidatus Merdibacter merdavium TaxID=2838692 RepID=A0A9D2SWS0_9FIRM|nr:aldo/keto reductase [Candidatus Merdibacter merdavium]